MDKVSETVARVQQHSKIDVRLVISVAVLSLMVFFRDMGYFAFAPLHFVAVVTLISLFLPYNSLRSFFFFYITVGISVYGLALFPIMLALILKNKKLNVFQIVFPIIILLFELFHFASYQFDVDTNRFIIYSFYIILFFYVLFDDNLDDVDVKNGMKYYILGTAIASLIIFLHAIINYGFQDILYETYRMGNNFDDYDSEKEMVTAMNPNQLAFYTITAFSILLYIKGIFRNSLSKVVLMIVLVFAGIMSASRTWIIIMAIVLVMYFLFSGMKGKFSFVLVTAIVFILAMRFNTYTEAIYSRFENRFEEASLSTAGHRTEIIRDYNQWLANNPQRMVYGAGSLYYTEICKINYSTHNSIQQIIVCYGILGLLIFTVCIFVYHKRYTRRNQARFWYCIPFIVCFIFSQTGQFLSPACMMLPFIAATLPLKLTPSTFQT